MLSNPNACTIEAHTHTYKREIERKGNQNYTKHDKEKVYILRSAAGKLMPYTTKKTFTLLLRLTNNIGGNYIIN